MAVCERDGAVLLASAAVTVGAGLPVEAGYEDKCCPEDPPCSCLNDSFGNPLSDDYQGCGSSSIVYAAGGGGYDACLKETVTFSKGLTCWDRGGTADCTAVGYENSDLGGCTAVVSADPNCIVDGSTTIIEGTTCWDCGGGNCGCLQGSGPGGMLFDAYQGCGSSSIVFAQGSGGYDTCLKATITLGKGLTCWDAGGVSDCTLAGYENSDLGGCASVVSADPNCIGAGSATIIEGTTCWDCGGADCGCLQGSGAGGALFDAYQGCGSSSVVFSGSAYNTCTKANVTLSSGVTCWDAGGTSDCTAAGYENSDLGGCTSVVSADPNCIGNLMEGTTCWDCGGADCGCLQGSGSGGLFDAYQGCGSSSVVFSGSAYNTCTKATVTLSSGVTCWDAGGTTDCSAEGYESSDTGNNCTPVQSVSPNCIGNLMEGTVCYACDDYNYQSYPFAPLGEDGEFVYVGH